MERHPCLRSNPFSLRSNRLEVFVIPAQTSRKRGSIVAVCRAVHPLAQGSLVTRHPVAAWLLHNEPVIFSAQHHRSSHRA